MSGRSQSGCLNTSGAVANHILSSIQQHEKYFERADFSGEWVLQIPKVFMLRQFFLCLPSQGSSGPVTALCTTSFVWEMDMNGSGSLFQRDGSVSSMAILVYVPVVIPICNCLIRWQMLPGDLRMLHAVWGQHWDRTGQRHMTWKNTFFINSLNIFPLFFKQLSSVGTILFSQLEGQQCPSTGFGRGVVQKIAGKINDKDQAIVISNTVRKSEILVWGPKRLSSSTVFWIRNQS